MKRSYSTGFQRNVYNVKLDNNLVKVIYKSNDKVVLDRSDVKKAFIGKSLKNKANPSIAYGTQHDGNSILLQMLNDEYIYIGETIYSFQLLDNIEKEVEWNDYFMMLAIINHDFKGIYGLFKKMIIKYVSELQHHRYGNPRSFAYVIDNNNNVYLLKTRLILKNLEYKYHRTPYLYSDINNTLVCYQHIVYDEKVEGYYDTQKYIQQPHFFVQNEETHKRREVPEETFIEIFQSLNKINNVQLLHNVSIHKHQMDSHTIYKNNTDFYIDL